MGEAKKKAEKDLELRLSPEDESLIRDVIQRLLQTSAEHSQIRSRFVHTTKEYQDIERKFHEDEEQTLDNLKLLAQEQQTTLKQLGQRMKVPEGYRLNLDNMTWEEPPPQQQ